MGKGTDAARLADPEGSLHADLIDDFKDQLLIVLFNRLGGRVSIPVAEVDGTGGFILKFNIVDRTFHFIVEKKQ